MFTFVLGLGRVVGAGVMLSAALGAMPAFAGTLYADTNTTLYTVNESTGVLTVVASGFTPARSIASIDGVLYVADFGSGNVSTVSGGIITPFITGLSGPYGLTSNSVGNILVSTNDGFVKTYDTTGTLLATSNLGGNLTDFGRAENGTLLVSVRNTGQVKIVGTNTQYAYLGSTGGFQNATRGIVTVGSTTFVNESTGVNGTTGTIFELNQSGTVTGTLFTDAANGPKGSAYDIDTGLIYYAAAGGVGAVGGGIYSFDPGSPGTSPTLLSALNPVFAFQDVEVVASVPEPATMMLLGFGLMGLAKARRSRRAALGT